MKQAKLVGTKLSLLRLQAVVTHKKEISEFFWLHYSLVSRIFLNEISQFTSDVKVNYLYLTIPNLKIRC